MIVPVFLPHLGCGERCIYCDQASITDLKTESMEETVAAHLDPVKGTYEVGLFGGNVFGLNHATLKRLFAAFGPYREKITGFRISTKPIPLNNETLEILKEGGVNVIELGIPSFNDRILALTNRGHTAKDLETSYGRLKEEGFAVALQVMTGLPEETMADIAETARRVIRLAPHYIRIYPLAVLKGTPLETMYREGSFTPIPFEEGVIRTLCLYLHATREGIPVVKMGLTDNEVIGDRVVAGLYHPAFGYVVKCFAFRLALLARFRDLPGKGDVKVILNRKDIPHLLGHKRSNMARFEAEGFQVSWEEGDREPGSFLLLQGGSTVPGDVYDALTMIPS